MNCSNVNKIVNQDELLQAFQLVYKKYVESNYVKAGQPLSIQGYLNQSSSCTYGAYVSDQMYGTISIVYDSEKGLPLESIYANEVSELRANGKYVAEVVQFAVDHDICKKYMTTNEILFAALPLFAKVLQDARLSETDIVFISVNPKHVSFYRQIGFSQFGELRHYEAVSAPAVGMQLDLKKINTEELKQSLVGRKILECLFQDEG